MFIKRTLTFHFSLKLTFIFSLLFFSTAVQSEDILILENTSGHTQTLTREQLEALPQTQFISSTPWTKEVHRYQGPDLKLVVDLLGSPLVGIQVYALNGYSYDISVKDLQQYPFILAIQQDGQKMSIRNKGPSWILLPFDKDPNLVSKDQLLNQCIWQISRIKAL